MIPLSTLLKEQIKQLSLYMPKFVLLSDYANLGNLLTEFTQSLLLAAGDDKDFQESVKDKDLVAPPAGPYAVGDRYIIAGIGGAWSTFAIDDIAEWDGSVWMDFKPNDGFTVFVEDEDKWYFYNGTSWAIRPPLDWDRTGTTLSPSIAGDDIDMGVGGMIKVDNITESTAGAGTTIETVLLKDNEVIANKLTSKSHPVYDVTQWGLKADGGTTDNSPLLAALIDQVIIDGGGTIYFPNTDSWYQFSSAVVKTLNNGLDVAITFLGEPSRQGNNEVALMWTAGVNGFQLTRGAVEFKNISIYGPAAIADFSAIYLDTAVYSSIENVYIQDAYNSIRIVGGLITTIKQCSFGTPVNGRGIWLYLTQDVVVDLCNFSGAYVGIDIDSNSYPNNISIRNCRFADGGSYGVYIHKAQNVYCENLTFGSAAAASEGIHLDTCSNVILDGIYFEELPTTTWDIFLENNPQNITLRNYKSVKSGYTGISDTSRMTIIGGEYDTPAQLPYVKGIVNRGADIISGVAGVKAIGKLVFTGDSIPTETLTINAQVHTYINSATPAANQLRSGTGADIASGRTARYFNELSAQKDKIFAVWDLIDTVYFYAKVPGVVANAYTFTETCTNASIPAPTGFMNNQQVGVDPVDTFNLDDATGTLTPKHNTADLGTNGARYKDGYFQGDIVIVGNVDGVDVSTLPGAISAKVAKAGDTMTGDLVMDNQKSVQFREADGGGDNYIGLKAPAALAGDVTFILPATDGNSGDCLKTDASGNLSWGAMLPLAGGVMLGDIAMDNQKTIQFREADGAGDNYIGLRAAAALGGNTTFILPTADGAANQVLKTDGSANLGWANPSLARVSVVKTYADFSAVAFTNTINIFSLPAGAAIKDIYANVTAGFVNPATAEAFLTDGTATGTFQIAHPFSTAAFAAGNPVQIDEWPAIGAAAGFVERIYLGAGAAAYDLDALIDGTAGGIITVGDPIGPVGLGLPALTVGDYLVVDNAPTLAEAFGCLVSKTDVTAASGVAATGSLIALAQGAGGVADGQIVMISANGLGWSWFEFCLDGRLPTGGYVAIDIVTGDDVADVWLAIKTAINGALMGVTAGGASPNVTLTNNNNGTIGNAAISELLTPPGSTSLTPVGMAGGIDAWELHIHDNLGVTGVAVDLSAYTVILGARVYSTVADMVHIDNGAGVDVDLTGYDVPAFMYVELLTDIIEMGIGGDTDKYLVAARDVMAPLFIGAAADKGVVISNGTTNVESFGGATNIVCRMDSTGALLSQLTAGSITFYMEYTI